MRRAVPFLATVLLAGAIENVAGQEIEIVASAGTVVLKVTIEPQDTFYALPKQELDYFARQLWDPKVAVVDALINKMVEESFNGGKVSNEDNKKAVQLRREWAQSVDSKANASPPPALSPPITIFSGAKPCAMRLSHAQSASS